MSNFQWDPTQDQTYSSESSQIVLTPTLSRNEGASFTMDAEECILDLKLHNPVNPDNYRYVWGDSGDSEGARETNVHVMAGTFRVSAQGIDCMLETGGETDVSTLGHGCLEFTDLGALNFGTEGENLGSINTKEESSILVHQCGIVNILSDVAISDYSRIEIKSPSLCISNTETRFTVSSQPKESDKYSLLYEMDNYADESDSFLGSIIFQRNSTSKFQAKSINVRKHTLENNARVLIKTDTYSCSGSTTLRTGAPELTIAPLNNEFVFDIQGMLTGNVKYPEGCFNFITTNGGNKGTLRLSADYANGFGFSILLQKKIIYIDDSPATAEKLAPDYAEMPGFITVRLQN